MDGAVKIANIALARLGESPIQNFGEGSVPANMAKIFYDSARRATLRDFNWNFAVAVAPLAKLAEKPVDFRSAFALPADCLRVLAVRGEGGLPVPFVIRAGALCTDAESVEVEYTYDCEDPALFDDKFVEAFSFKLASELAMPVKGSAELMANYMNVYNAFVERAATISADEEQQEPISDNPYVEARFNGSY